jgi:hypothetical protein
MFYTFTDKQGLVLTDVRLKGRKMAERISIPYYWITAFTPGLPEKRTRGELRLNGGRPEDAQLFSQIIKFEPQRLADRLVLQADYGIDKIPGAPNSCLKISQQFEFFKSGFDVPIGQESKCEPSGSITTCTKFRPMISYKFTKSGNESLKDINIPIRLHFEVLDNAPDTIVATRDVDEPSGLLGSGTYFSGVILDPKKSRIPARMEEWWSVVRKDLPDTGLLDNFHQTNKKVFQPPTLNWDTGVTPGCPECVHMHWRWSRQTPDARFKPGKPLIPPGSNQAIDVALALYKPDEDGNQFALHDYAQTLNGESIRDGDNRKRVVIWF